jgi:hypothetical protein
VRSARPDLDLPVGGTAATERDAAVRLPGSVAASQTLGPLFKGFPTVSLPDLVALADLQRRYDEKYVIHVEVLARMLARLGPSTRVLEVDGRRATVYDTQYLDTPDLRSYRDHVQERRRRYKIRTRCYGDTGPAMLEVKLKGNRGSTIKHRRPRAERVGVTLAGEEQAFVTAVLRDSYGWSVPAPLGPAARLRFQRVTLVDVAAAERLTIDVGLIADVDGRRVDFDRTKAIVEVKSPVLRGVTRRRLLDLGLRPGRVSKYGVAIAAAQANVPAAPWRRVLRTLSPSVSAPTELRCPPSDDGVMGLSAVVGSRGDELA